MSLEVGDRFSAKLKVTKTGTGSVKADGKTITVGPVVCDEGTHAHLKYLGERVLDSMTINYAICLTEEAIDSQYEEYLDQIIDILTPEGPPSPGEITYAKVNRYDDDGVAYANLGDAELCLGPVNAEVDGFVQIEGYSNTHAKVLTDSVKSDSYELQFKLLTEQVDALPVELGKVYQTAVAEFVDERPVAYIKNIPVRLPECDAKLGQKIDVELEDFAGLYAVGDVVEMYDEVSRIDSPGQWARMQWLQESGYREDPLLEFASDFTGVPASALPEDSSPLSTALIGECFRLAMADKAQETTAEFPRAHISGIRHWVIHKLAPILGDPDDETDTGLEDAEDGHWFINTLRDGQGPTLTFLGDIIELSEGYYTVGPTRAVMSDDGTAVLISGKPTREFTNRGFDVEIRGLSRIIQGTTQDELSDAGIAIQSLSEYTGTADQPAYDLSYLKKFIAARETQPWAGEDSWLAYAGSGGYGFDWDETAVEVNLSDGRLVSLWKRPIEYEADEYYLQVTGDAVGEVQMVRVPIQYYKRICLLIDDDLGIPRHVEFSTAPGGIHLRCNFSPTKHQMRWLTAIGGKWRGYRQGYLHWLIEPSAVESVRETFNALPVTIQDNID